MTIFRYTLIKFLKTPSTWILLIFCGGLLFWISGLPFHTWGRNWNLKSIAEQQYDMKTAFIASYSALGAILSLSITLFAGFKGAQVFRDEIEDGSFLLVLSKPISRFKIILFKWLAFMALFLIFGFLLSLVHALGAMTEMKGTFVRNKIIAAIPLEFLIIIVFILIFSSIALMISTFLSSRGVMGIMFVLGIGIVFTQILSSLTYTPAFTKFDVSKNGKRTETAGELYARKTQLKNSDILKGDINNLFLEENNLYVPNPMAVNTYKHLWPFDLSYHINMMDSIVVKTVFRHDDSEKNKTFGIKQKVLFDGYHDKSELMSMENYSFLQGDKYENMNILLNQYRAPMYNNLWDAQKYLIAETNDYINKNLVTIAANNTKLTILFYNSNFYNEKYTTSDTFLNAKGNPKNGTDIINDWKTIFGDSDNKTIQTKTNTSDGKTITINNKNNIIKLFRILDDTDYKYSSDDLNTHKNQVKNNIISFLMGYFETDTIKNQIDSWASSHKHLLNVNYYQLLTTGSNELSKVATHLNISVKNGVDGKLTDASLDKLHDKIVKVKYADFVSNYAILGFYIGLSVILVPLTFITIIRKDFS